MRRDRQWLSGRRYQERLPIIFDMASLHLTLPLTSDSSDELATKWPRSVAVNFGIALCHLTRIRLQLAIYFCLFSFCLLPLRGAEKFPKLLYDL
jgi:hypothetical protein